MLPINEKIYNFKRLKTGDNRSAKVDHGVYIFKFKA